MSHGVGVQFAARVLPEVQGEDVGVEVLRQFLNDHEVDGRVHVHPVPHLLGVAAVGGGTPGGEDGLDGEQAFLETSSALG